LNMVSRKLKNFEFSNYKGRGKDSGKNNDEVVFFECINGNVFLLCWDSNTNNNDINPAELAAQRMRYYLENEFVADPSAAIINALKYTNGFIFENARKNEQYQGAYVHCACVLIRESKVYYSAIGSISIKYYPGRKLYLLAQGSHQDETLTKTHDEVTAGFLLGMNREINPWVNNEPLVPLDGDILMVGNKGFFDGAPEKNILKILEDPMPLQTKAARLSDLAISGGIEENVSFQLISFYNLDQKARSFVPLSGISKPTQSKPTIGDNKNIGPFGWEKLTGKVTSTPLKYILILIAALLLGFMVYDMFFSMPARVVRVEPGMVDTVAPFISETVPTEVIQPVTVPPVVQTPARKIPDDRNYQVKPGDTWSRIYTQFGVCSWFIINHPPNAGKFDRDDNPVSGSRLVIPVIYSARRDMNPDFYREFSLEKTGTRCENVDQEFVNTFKRTYQVP